MDSPATITLREAGRRLSVIRRKRGIADSELLSLLRDGQLTAGFYFDGRSDYWITIPTSYWMKKGSDDFRAIRVSDDRRNRGAYKVRISEFADELSQLIRDRSKAEQKDKREAYLLETLRSAVSNASKKYEVLIKEPSWAGYLEKNNISASAQVRRSTRGRHEKESWKQICVILAAYIMKHGVRNDAKIEPIGIRIRQLAEKEGMPDLPKAATINEVVSDAKSKANDPDFG